MADAPVSSLGQAYTAARSPFLSFWGPVIAYMALIFVLSSMSTLPSPPGGLSYYHAHFAAYAGLAVLTTRALAKGWRDVTWDMVFGAIVISTLYGLSDEYHQQFVPGRNFDLLDLAADAVGSVVGASGVRAWSIIGPRS